MAMTSDDEPVAIWNTQHALDGPTDDSDEPATEIWAHRYDDGRIGLNVTVYPRTEFTLCLPPWEVRSMIDALNRQRHAGLFDD